MSITTLTAYFSKYVAIPIEKFSEKYACAVGLFELFNNPNEEDRKRLMSFKDEVSIDIPVPLAILDRDINPTKGDFKFSNNKVIYTIKLSDGRNSEIVVDENQMQKALYDMILEVNQIVMRNMKPYQLEQEVHQGSSNISTELANIIGDV